MSLHPAQLHFCTGCQKFSWQSRVYKIVGDRLQKFSWLPRQTMRNHNGSTHCQEHVLAETLYKLEIVSTWRKPFERAPRATATAPRGGDAVAQNTVTQFRNAVTGEMGLMIPSPPSAWRLHVQIAQQRTGTGQRLWYGLGPGMRLVFSG